MFDIDFRPLIWGLLIAGAIGGVAIYCVVSWLVTHVSISWA